MTSQKPQKPVTTEKKHDPQHKPDQHEKDKKDKQGLNQPARSAEAKRTK